MSNTEHFAEVGFIDQDLDMPDMNDADFEDDASSEYSAEDETDQDLDDELRELQLEYQAARIQEIAQARTQFLERFSVPVNGRVYTRCPPNFPTKLRELIGYIPLQNGRSIRPAIIKTFTQNFTVPTLVTIGNFLSLAPRRVLKHIALLISDILQYDSLAVPHMFVHMPTWIPSEHWVPILAWLDRLGDEEQAGRAELPFAMENFRHTLSAHTTLQAAPMVGEQFIRIIVDPCDAYPLVRRTTIQTKNFVDALPGVTRADLGENDQCSICLQPFTPDKETEQPVKLPCGHLFGRECLLLLFAPQADPTTEHDRCPLCRAQLDIINGGILNA